MGRMGRDTRMKRQVAPAFWEIPRKEKRFVPKVSPGPHLVETSYPIGIVLRDLLKVVNIMKEAKYVVSIGEIKIDSIVRKDVNFPVGLMDVIEITSTDKTYRMVPKDGVIVKPIEIPKEEKNLKLCKVIRKLTVKNKKLQYGFHDGRTLVDDQKMNVNDTCLITLPEQKITNTVKLEKGSTALIISGENAGTVGKIGEVREGTFILPKRVVLALENRKVELPVDMIMVVGTDKPLITIR
jgi:small subunit ribosomal protein S4e